MLDMDERQHALDRTVAFGAKKIGPMAEAAFDDALPAGAMEEGRLGASLDEAIPFGKARLLQLRHQEAAGGSIHHHAQSLLSMKTRSMRDQAKSPSSRSSRASMRRRLM